MSSYSSNLRKPMIRNNAAMRSEYNDSMLRDCGRADNRLQEQYKELERGRKVIEADLRKQKKVIAASAPRRSSFPSHQKHTRIHAQILAEKSSADERLNKFLSTQSRTGQSPARQGKSPARREQPDPRGRRRAQTDSRILGPAVTNINLDDTEVNQAITTKDRGENITHINSEDAGKPKRKTRQDFFDALSKPKHAVQDKRAIRAKIEGDMEKTRKTERRLSRPSNDYLQGGY